VVSFCGLTVTYESTLNFRCAPTSDPFDTNTIGRVLLIDEHGLTMSVPVGRAPRNESSNTKPKSWREFLKRLPPAKRDLLKGCKELSCAPTSRPLWELLLDDTVQLTFVSDVSHISERGTFGWALAHGERLLWECSGNARGWPMSSYRAEAYGKASWLQFLTAYAECFDLRISCSVVGYCDNLEIVRQTNLAEAR
jgi:hypothetical protein